MACKLHVDIVKKSSSTTPADQVPKFAKPLALAELVRAVAAEEEQENSNTTSMVKHVYIRVEYDTFPS